MRVKRSFEINYPLFLYRNTFSPKYTSTLYDAQFYHRQKRQRKQAAGALVVDSLFSTGKKTTAQPRPALQVPPRGIGPIRHPNQNDVLCGRGGRINAHEGNVQFREIVLQHKKEYLSKTTKKLEKAHIAARIIQQIRTMDPPGRFLKEDADTNFWFDIGDAKAIKKAGQALREDAPDLRTENEPGENIDKKEEKKTTNTNTAKKTTKSKKVSTSKSPNTKQLTSLNPPELSTATRGLAANSGIAQMPANIAQQDMRQKSWNSSESSSFGMPFPQDGKIIPAGFPSGVSDGSQHRMYRGLRSMGNKFGTMSKQAMEIMHFQQAQQQFQQARPDEVAFGRGFTPTEISGVSGLSGVSANTMSTISGMSGLSNPTSSNMGGSNRSKAVMSSLSSGIPYVHPVTNSATHSLRLSNLTSSLQNSGNLSDLTSSYMAFSGLQRSPSFENLPNTSLSKVLDAEDRNVADIFEKTMPPPPRGVVRGSAASTAMSIASCGSTDNSSWMNTYDRISGVGIGGGGSISSQGSAAMTGSSMLWPGDDRSIMSDVSESILALDLASPATQM